MSHDSILPESSISKAAWALRMLSKGSEIKLDGYTYKLYELERGGVAIYVKAWNETRGEECPINSALELNQFISLCGRLTDEEMFSIAASATLSENNGWGCGEG